LEIPRHVAIIMDGNGRWAMARGLPRLAGHRAGTENIRRILEASVRFGIPILTIYAFSTENWQRPPAEVQGLLRIFEEVIERELAELHAQGVQLRHVGWPDPLPARLREQVQRAVELTRNNSRIILNVAFNYGGRLEIVKAVQAIVRSGVPPDQVTEELIERHLCTAGLPDPDLIIRTGGEMRLSNFLIWQAAYAEYYSTPTFWPDFDEAELHRALVAYNQRERRFGRVPQPVPSPQSPAPSPQNKD
jgi:undecaprenyl diphosphate synthase